MIHVTFYSPTLVDDTVAAWNRNILIGPVSDLQGANEASMNFYNRISSGQSNVAAILAGHVHFNHEDMVGSVPQIVTGDAFEGFCRLVNLVPAK